MLKRLLSLALGLGALAVPAVAATSNVEAASQITVWKASGMQQTANSYWQPTLNQPNDYTRPTNYADGRAYIKLEIVSKPSDLAVKPNICFWRHTEVKKFHFETCARSRDLGFNSEGTYYFDLNAPNKWWKKNGVFDWSIPPTLGRVMIKDDASGKLLLSSRCGAACYEGDDLADHIPIKMNSELIFVAKGKTLNPPANWRSDCPSSWASACRGGDGSPAPAPAPTPPPTTTPPPPPPADEPPTEPSNTAVNNLRAQVQDRALIVRYGHPDAKRFQMRYQQQGSKRVWTSPTTATRQTISDLRGGVPVDIEVRALIGSTWREWTAITATPSGSGGGTPPPGGGSGAMVTASVQATRLGPAIELEATSSKIGVEYSHPKATRY
ncbi:MAG: hypothetical protein AAFP84_14235, partial [Actinomycetota bacterium]